MSSHKPFAAGYRAAVFGASGGIGAALIEALKADGNCSAIHAGARSVIPAGVNVLPFVFDLENEDTIAAAAQAIAMRSPELDLVIVATVSGRGSSRAIVQRRNLRLASASSDRRPFVCPIRPVSGLGRQTHPVLSENRTPAVHALLIVHGRRFSPPRAHAGGC